MKEKLGDDNVMDTVVKIFDYKSAIEQGSDGENLIFQHDFVKQVWSDNKGIRGFIFLKYKSWFVWVYLYIV